MGSSHALAATLKFLHKKLSPPEKSFSFCFLTVLNFLEKYPHKPEIVGSI